MVAHNFNLAIVCDVKRIIFFDFEGSINFKLNYISRVIEGRVVNILEGTMMHIRV